MLMLLTGVLLGVTFTLALLGLTRASADQASDLASSAGTLSNAMTGSSKH